MSEAAPTMAPEAENRAALASLVLGLLAGVSFVFGDASGGALFLVGAILAAAAIAAGVAGRRRARAGAGRRYAAATGLLLGLLILAWFGIFGLLAALGVVNT